MAAPTTPRSLLSPISKDLLAAASFPSPPSPTVASAVDPASPLDAFASDPVLSAFLSPSFSPSEFSSAARSSGLAASRAEQLQDAIRLLLATWSPHGSPLMGCACFYRRRTLMSRRRWRPRASRRRGRSTSTATAAWTSTRSSTCPPTTSSSSSPRVRARGSRRV